MTLCISQLKLRPPDSANWPGIYHLVIIYRGAGRRICEGEY